MKNTLNYQIEKISETESTEKKGLSNLIKGIIITSLIALPLYGCTYGRIRRSPRYHNQPRRIIPRPPRYHRPSRQRARRPVINRYFNNRPYRRFNQPRTPPRSRPRRHRR